MKNNFWVLFTCLLTILCFNACQKDSCINKDQFLTSFDMFIDEINKIDVELTPEQKTNFIDRYKSIVNNCYKKYKDQLTLQERQAFWTKSVKSYFKLHKGNINVLIEDDEDPFNQYVKQEIEALIEASGDDFAEVISGLIQNELPNLIDMFIEEVAKFGDSLKENIDK